MKNMAECFAEISFLNDHPENAKAIGLAVEMEKSCHATMQKRNYHDTAIKEGIDRANRDFNAGLTLCESPIEALTLAGLLYADYGRHIRIPPRVCLPGEPPEDCGAVIYPQFTINKYRLDFLVIGRSKDGRFKWINVECDGHEFHQEVSRKTWDEDRKRDAAMKEFGMDVFRFTGAEIWQNAMGCAYQVADSLAEWSASNGG